MFRSGASRFYKHGSNDYIANVTENTKKRIIKEITGHSGCWSCGGIPTLEVSYPVKDGGATQIERYCEDCIKKLYERDQVF